MKNRKLIINKMETFKMSVTEFTKKEKLKCIAFMINGLDLEQQIFNEDFGSCGLRHAFDIYVNETNLEQRREGSGYIDAQMHTRFPELYTELKHRCEKRKSEFAWLSSGREAITLRINFLIDFKNKIKK
jgi:uncharacterized protein YbbK (DUF523 family)